MTSKIPLRRIGLGFFFGGGGTRGEGGGRGEAGGRQGGGGRGEAEGRGGRGGRGLFGCQIRHGNPYADSLNEQPATLNPRTMEAYPTW